MAGSLLISCAGAAYVFTTASVVGSSSAIWPLLGMRYNFPPARHSHGVSTWISAGAPPAGSKAYVTPVLPDPMSTRPPARIGGPDHWSSGAVRSTCADLASITLSLGWSPPETAQT